MYNHLSRSDGSLLRVRKICPNSEVALHKNVTKKTQLPPQHSNITAAAASPKWQTHESIWFDAIVRLVFIEGHSSSTLGGDSTTPKITETYLCHSMFSETVVVHPFQYLHYDRKWPGLLCNLYIKMDVLLPSSTIQCSFYYLYGVLLVIHHQIRIMTVEKKNVKMQLRCCWSHKVASLGDDPRGNLIKENVTGGWHSAGSSDNPAAIARISTSIQVCLLCLFSLFWQVAQLALLVCHPHRALFALHSTHTTIQPMSDMPPVCQKSETKPTCSCTYSSCPHSNLQSG